MTAILAAFDASFRNRMLGRLVAAGYDDLQVASLPAELAELLRDSARALVVAGGDWADTRPFLRVAVNAGVPAVVLLDSSAPEAEGEALEAGARAALPSDMGAPALAAALRAVEAGLLVLDPGSRTLLRAAAPARRPALASSASASSHSPQELAPARSSRPLTTREREILSLVASGTSNKGIARVLAVSANTVKFHLAAVFDKLDAATRAEAVAEAIRRGELSL